MHNDFCNAIIAGLLLGIFVVFTLFLGDISKDIHYIKTAIELKTSSK